MGINKTAYSIGYIRVTQILIGFQLYIGIWDIIQSLNSPQSHPKKINNLTTLLAFGCCCHCRQRFNVCFSALYIHRAVLKLNYFLKYLCMVNVYIISIINELLVVVYDTHSKAFQLVLKCFKLCLYTNLPSIFGNLIHQVEC